MVKIDHEKKIAYVKHPVAREKVEALRARGLEVLDIRFAPKGLAVEPESESTASPTGGDAPKAERRTRKVQGTGTEAEAVTVPLTRNPSAPSLEPRSIGVSVTGADADAVTAPEAVGAA